MNDSPTFPELKRLAKKSFAEQPQFKLAILGDCATQHIATAVKGEAYRRNYCIDVLDCDYDQIRAQIMDSDSELYRFQPDAVLILMCTEKLYALFTTLPTEQRTSFADSTMQQITAYWDVISTHLPTVQIVQYNFADIDDGVFGNYALKTPEAFPFQLTKLNYLFTEACAEHKQVFPVNLNALQASFGQQIFCDKKLYYVAKMPFSPGTLPSIATKTVDVLLAKLGRLRKCVIVDLDNTLWGGVIGDDGIEGIQIGELGTGHAYSDLQLWLKQLQKRGILLAVCSKNNEDTAKAPFLEHPEMVLHLDDFAMFVANWNDKASNIRLIRQTLNIGMDSIVFLDDNPFEREQVRGQIPDITVPDLPEDPAQYLSTLRSLNLFETASYSAADTERTQQYRQEAERAVLQTSCESYDDYLKGLNMVAVSAPFDAFHTPRIAQLTQRSNQFNLRTIRYTEAEISQIAADPNCITRYYLLKDRFGDYGLISVVIMELQPDHSMFVSEWLMSCRVLKRGMEEFIINDILTIAKQYECTRVIGEYIKTQKNAMVADLYERLGFVRNGEQFIASTEDFAVHTTYIGRDPQ